MGTDIHESKLTGIMAVTAKGALDGREFCLRKHQRVVLTPIKGNGIPEFFAFPENGDDDAVGLTIPISMLLTLELDGQIVAEGPELAEAAEMAQNDLALILREQPISVEE